MPLSRAIAPAVFIVASIVCGCSSSEDGMPGESSDSVAPAQPASTAAPTCKNHEAGCPCDREGERAECGTVTETRPDGRIVCGPGGTVCTAGKWTQCTMDAYAPNH